MSILIKLIADAPTAEYMIHAMKLFSFCIKQTPRNALEMKRHHSYHLLAGILASKYAFFTPELQGLIFDLSLHDDGNGFETSVITNVPAFQHLLLDYNVWRKSNAELVSCLYINIRQLISKSTRRLDNISVLRSLDLVEKLFNIIMDFKGPPRLVEICFAILGSYLYFYLYL
jgi:hypothetical protein